jgi:hypothetical protein
MRRSPLLWLLIFLAGLVFAFFLAPAEKTLGPSARVVYLHGVWVWTALVAFLVAGLVGLAGLLLRNDDLHPWSRALGRTGLVFWISYLPISMWAMQSNWNGLFLAEPRWRVAMIFAIGGLVLQVGLALLGKPFWASIFNIVYIVALIMTLRFTDNVMHPPSPILDSHTIRIQVHFFSMLIMTFLIAWQVARLWYRLEMRPNTLALQLEMNS